MSETGGFGEVPTTGVWFGNWGWGTNVAYPEKVNVNVLCRVSSSVSFQWRVGLPCRSLCRPKAEAS